MTFTIPMYNVSKLQVRKTPALDTVPFLHITIDRPFQSSVVMNCVVHSGQILADSKEIK